MKQQPLAVTLLNALKAYGAQEIFGIPGDFALPFFRVIEEANVLPLYTLSHEPGVGFAADAAARYNCTLGVAAVTYGAGALNLVNSVAQAYAEKSPVVVISGAPGTQEGEMGLGLHHQVKRLDTQLLVYREITCDQAVLNDARTAPAEIARVLTSSRWRSRPVYIEFPRDMVDAVVGPVPPYSEPAVSCEAAQACAVEALARLKSAENPAILIGVEVRRYGLEDKVSKLAKILRLPVATSFMGHGLLAGSDAPLIGTYLGLAGEDHIRHVIERSDALLMLGVILCDTNFGVSKRQIDIRNAIHAFDLEVRFAHHVYPDISLVTLIDALLAIAEPVGDSEPISPPVYPSGLAGDESPVTPSDIACAVNDSFAEHGRMPIASDVGDCLFTTMDIENTELVAPGYYSSMGMGVPAGLGIQVASGQRALVLVGDGAFQMTGWELGNCRKYGWNPIVLLFNNKSWEMLRTLQPGPAYHDLEEWKFAELAKSLGGGGRRVTTRRELALALKQAFADESRFHLIEIMLDKGIISITLQRFADAIRRLSVLGNEDKA